MLGNLRLLSDRMEYWLSKVKVKVVVETMASRYTKGKDIGSEVYDAGSYELQVRIWRSKVGRV